MLEIEREYYRQRGIIMAIWAVDSETGIEYLMDLYNNCKIAKRVNGRIVDPDFQEKVDG